MDFALKLLVASVSIAVFTSLSIRFLQPLITRIKDEQTQKLVNNILALIFGIGWSFGISLYEGFASDAPSIMYTIMRGFFGAGLSVFGYEFFKHTLSFVQAKRNDQDAD